MHDTVTRYPGTLVTLDAEIERDFESRVRESSDLAVRIAYGVVRQRQDAEEIAQEAFVRAYRSFSTMRERNAFRSWVVRTTWRLAIDRWRSDRSRTAREQHWVQAPDATPESVASANQRAARLWAAIDELPEKLRQTIVLSAIQGYDVREVAALLDLPEGTVKSRLYLARKALAQRLQCLVTDTGRR
jgi:RNA polymerase sigma-70 factor (ECF subfamily)